ncbi:MAG: xanthine dehydrogenase family protein molybdopterin-binding subunit [Dehalococcoidia bacterium]|nr:xanthine dehydrogenase family protein molybdopterin-binding subunit [Dehalococcoidia bacterium]
MSYAIVGRSIPKVDARQKATGEAIYAGDLHMPGMLCGMILGSTRPHARLVAVDTSEAKLLPGVMAVVTGQDAGRVRIGRFIKDRTILAVDKVRYIGEPVAAVAAVDRATAEQALSLIRVTYEDLPAVFNPVDALQPGAPIIHEDLGGYLDTMPSKRYGNVRNEVRYAWGDMEAALSGADLVQEETFATQAVHAGYLEPRIAIASAEPSGRLTIWSSNKAPFVFRSQVSQALGMPVSQVRMIALTVGGDHGGKGLATIEPICGLLALKCGRPVRLELSRTDEFCTGFGRHPSVTKLKTAMRRDGSLLAVQGEITFDSGGYSDAITGLAHACFNLVGPYRAQAVDVVGLSVYTNNIPGGHVRAPGAPQTIFAIESQIDIMARKLGLDPWAVRRLNAVDEGSMSATGHGVLRNVALRQCLDEAQRASEDLKKDGPNQGIGIGCSQWEVFPFEHVAPSRAMVTINEDGSATLLSGVTEQGGGQYTTIAQIAAEELGLGLGDIGLVVADTDASPFESSTGASATTQRAGNSVRFAAQDARDQLLALAAEKLEASPSDLVLENRRVFVRGVPDKGVHVADLIRTAIMTTGGPVMGTSVEGQKRLLTAMQAASGIIDSPSYGVQAARVEVDPETGDVRLLSYLTAQDAGFALNPVNVEAQIEGGIVFSVGFALGEEVTRENGRVLVQNLHDYRMPTAVDVPYVSIGIVEKPSTFGPYGAKGVGESGTTPVAAVIANAVEDAVGVRITDLPITPEKVLRAMKQKQRER